MQRHLTLALMLGACSTGARNQAAAPAPPPPPPPRSPVASESTRATPPMVSSLATSQAAPSGAAAEGGGAAAESKRAEDTTALDAARTSASLGPSAPTDAFEPLDKDSEPDAAVRIELRLANGKPAPSLQMVFAANMSRFAECRQSDALGAYVIAFRVLANGTLARAKVTSAPTKSGSVGTCLVGVLEKLALHKATAPASANVTLKFE